MSKNTCTLCGLPTPDPPITDPEVDGQFCCTGCLQVHELLQDMDPKQAEKIREETISQRRKEWEAEEPPESSREAFLKVDGMHCSTCESFIESMSRRQDGIYKSEASYASEMVKVYYDPQRITEDALPGLISRMGYKAHSMDSVFGEDNFNTLVRLLLGGIFSILGLIVYILVFYPIYLTGKPLVPFESIVQYFFIANLFAMSSIVLFFTGFPILRGAWVSLSVMKPNMDLLIALAALSAYLFSTCAMFMGLNEIYFDVTMAIIMVVSLGNYYESRIKKDKNSLLTDLMENRIKQARVQRNGNLETIDLDELMPGDHVVVKAGERIPVDGNIIEGEGVVNEALITGESLPVTKKTGDRAISGTILTQNALTIETDEEVQNTLEKMIHLMWNIQAHHSGKQRLADKIAAYFVPGVLILGVVTFGYQLIIGTAVTAALLSALSVLIVSCPCAIGLATPLAVASGLRDALKNNIIFKTGAVFEEQSDTDILAFDKTGTLTTGHMQLLDEGTDAKALGYARSIEQFSSHPVARAIAESSTDSQYSVQNFRSYSRGVTGEVNGSQIYIGQPEWLQENDFQVSSEQWKRIEKARQNGHLPTGIAWDQNVQSIIIIGDQVRDETVSFITSLKEQGKRIAIITGDSEEASRPIREKLQPDYLFTGARPESKPEIVNQLKNFGSVTMIGDGSNDALALADADLGIAFGDLTAIAAESAQIVIPGDRLQKILMAFNAMRQTKKRIRQNLGWAFLYNATAIPLAIAGLINPLFAALAMAGSSLLVVSNSSRKMKL
ncbi:MAG TPA: cation-translocating P-type ATPase [Balneolaceae bacterium]|nr:cation-translocating P-type ATPase [Balneolaceae bacterium]